MPSDTFWRGRRVLVTGHTGFKGSWLCAWLDALGAQVSGIALPPADHQRLLFDRLDLPARVSSAFIDLKCGGRVARHDQVSVAASKRCSSWAWRASHTRPLE